MKEQKIITMTRNDDDDNDDDDKDKRCHSLECTTYCRQMSHQELG